MAKLTFAEKHDFYSTYTTRYGVQVHLHDKTYQRLFPLAELDLVRLWNDFSYRRAGQGRRARFEYFQEELRVQVVDPDAVDHLGYCRECSSMKHADEWVKSVEGYTVCLTCAGTYYTICSECEKHTRATNTIEDGRILCNVCIGNHPFTYCERCRTWYDAQATRNTHRHDGSDCCDSPEESMQFVIRNDGADPLPNDTLTRVTLPAGELSREGVQQIAMYLNEQRYLTNNRERQVYWRELSRRISEIGPKWQAKEGNFTKRLSKFAYQEYAFKIPPSVISEIGNIGARHATATDFILETSRLLNQTAAEWGHSGSCWWTQSIHSRCALKSNGGFGIRTFDHDGDDRQVTGRCWVYPLKKTSDKPPMSTAAKQFGWLVPTFETLEPDAFMVFNGYHALEGYAGPRLVAHLAGMTYRKVSCALGPNSYVNNGSAYIVAPEDIAQHFTDGGIRIEAPQHSTLFAEERGVRNVEQELKKEKVDAGLPF